MVGLSTWPLDARTGAYALLGVVLLIAAVADALTGKVHNAVTYPALLAALAWHTVFGSVRGRPESIGLSGALLGVVVGFGPLFVAWRAGGIGGGDAKLMAVVGAFGGWRFALAAMFWGFAVAAVMALAVMIRKRITKRTLGRIWRFLFVAAGGSKPGDPTGPDSPTIPFGLALCIGSAVVLVDEWLGGPIFQRFFQG
jgi:prepilin signal peptidase PulO-like enzyme (type II secretory pathway)